ncbi:LuxR C-terminal-related transcriptional regulator [Hymenobacter aerophilus]|uniref:LuxR C-terminal-related transcriptional regulator n=1 Tax=Hymenobacter aerophilus TaxID=119644 RepID=UPI00037A95C8|nr:helix-turn-helix transcriptional regulator [Hymenobacter aerophilus]
MKVEQRIERSIAGVAAVADLFPGIVSVHDLRTLGVWYMSAPGLRLLRTTLPTLRALGRAYYQQYFDPEDAAAYVRCLRDVSTSTGASAPLLQRLRAAADQPWSWHLSTVGVLLPDEVGQPLLSLTFSSSLGPLTGLNPQVVHLLEESLFLRQQQALFRQLTPRERGVLRLLALGYTSTAIARQLAISPNTVLTHRRNINAKLKPKSTYELLHYAQAFNMV